MIFTYVIDYFINDEEIETKELFEFWANSIEEALAINSDFSRGIQLIDIENNCVLYDKYLDNKLNTVVFPRLTWR